MPSLTFLLLLMLFAFGLVAGSGRNFGMQSAEEFAVWHRTYGRTLRMISCWGLGILAASLVTRVFG